MKLAKQYDVNLAPFFLVERERQEPEVYTVYFKFVQEVLNKITDKKDAAKDILDANPGLDFL